MNTNLFSAGYEVNHIEHGTSNRKLLVFETTFFLFS